MKALLTIIGICIVLPFCSTWFASPKSCNVAYGNGVCHTYGKQYYGLKGKELNEFKCHVNQTWNHNWCIIPDKYKNITPRWRYVKGLHGSLDDKYAFKFYIMKNEIKHYIGWQDALWRFVLKPEVWQKVKEGKITKSGSSGKNDLNPLVIKALKGKPWAQIRVEGGKLSGESYGYTWELNDKNHNKLGDRLLMYMKKGKNQNTKGKSVKSNNEKCKKLVTEMIEAGDLVRPMQLNQEILHGENFDYSQKDVLLSFGIGSLITASLFMIKRKSDYAKLEQIDIVQTNVI